MNLEVVDNDVDFDSEKCEKVLVRLQALEDELELFGSGAKCWKHN